MFAALFNVILYVLAFMINIYKSRSFNIYTLILLIYCITSILCADYYFNNLGKYELAVFPFIYLFFTLLVFIYPFNNLKFDVRKIKFRNTNPLKILTLIYIVSGVIAVVYGLPKTLSIMSSGEYGELRNQLYSDADSIELYSSTLERLAKNINSYLGTFGIILSFYQLTKPKFSKVFTILLFLSWILPSFLASTLVASRGLVVFLLMKIAVAYIFFKDGIPQNRKKWFWILGTILCVYLFLYLTIVSESRFGADARDSFKFYLGHSMLSFNDNVVTDINKYAGGKYFFRWFIDAFGGNSAINTFDLGLYHVGTSFYTFIGSFYIDFGPIGTLIIAFIISLILKNIAVRNPLQISDISILMYFANYYAQGVFVSAPGSALSWLMAFVVYFILKYAENQKITK